MSWLEEHWAEILTMPAIRSKRAACAVVMCDRPSQALGLCVPHYNAARQRFDPEHRKAYLLAKRERGRARREEARARAAGGGPPRGAPFDAEAGIGDAETGRAGPGPGGRP